MTARRAPRSPEQRQAQWTRSLIPGTLNGGSANASAVLAGPSRMAAARRAGQQTFGGSLFAHDTFTLSAATPTLTLTYLPVNNPAALVFLGPLYLAEGTDYTLSGMTLTVLAAAKALSGDVLEVRYQTLGDVPTTPTDLTFTASVLLKLDEASGTVASDSSGNGRNGTYSGSPGFSAASLLHSGTGHSVTFSGAEKVDIPYGSWLNTSTLTVEAFVKTTGAGIMSVWDLDANGSFGRVFQFRLNAGKVEFIIIGGTSQTVTSTATVNNGASHHIAATVDGSNVKLYIDGTLDTTVAQSLALATPGFDLLLGVNQSAGFTQYFVGQIDEAAYYAGTVLTASQIASRAAQ